MSVRPCKTATSAPDAHVEIGVEGYYTLRVMKADADGNPIESTAREIEFPNLITNFGMDAIGSDSQSAGDHFWHSCVVGTGNTPPANTDTTLVSQIAAAADTAVQGSGGDVTRQVATSPRWIQISRTWRFAAGTAAGNLTEVGIRRGTGTPQNLFSRALIADAGGNPTTLTVLSDEILDVTYRFRYFIPESDVTGTVVLNGVTHNFTLRPINIIAGQDANEPGWPTTFRTLNTRNGPRAGGSTGAVNSNSTANCVATIGMAALDAALPNLNGISDRGTTDVVLPAYVAGSYTRDIVFTWGLTIGNSAGIQLAVLSTPLGSFQIGFSPAFTKLNTQQLRFTLRVTWARRP